MSTQSKLYIVDRVRTDLRNDIYELMTHAGYHALEKNLTESLVNANKLFKNLRTFSLNPDIPAQEKEAKRAAFAYLIYREMNARLGGFHFDRYKCLSSGELQDRVLNEVMESFDFEEFVRDTEKYAWIRQESDFRDFIESRQYRNLEDSITSVIKKNKVIPALGRAIAQDIVDALHLDQNYAYVRIPDAEKLRTFDFPPQDLFEQESLKKISISANDEICSVLLKRCSRTSDQFRYLLTDFGALIKGI